MLATLALEVNYIRKACGVDNSTLEAVSYTHLDVYKRQVYTMLG